MKLTEKNVGDIIQRYADGERIMITGVSEHTVHFKRESWDGLYSRDNEDNAILGSVDRSPESLQSFLNTQTYASVLDAAQMRAFTHAISGDREEAQDGEYSLRLILEQKQALQDRLKEEARGRKEDLVVDFLKDYETFPNGFKTDFFGVAVEKPMDGKGMIIEGELQSENVSLKQVLLNKDRDPNAVKRPSFNDLIKDAASRRGNNKTEANEPVKKRANSEIYKF